MCGRFVLEANAAALAEYFAAPPDHAFPPRYNIAPTQPILIVRDGQKGGQKEGQKGRETVLVRWGLVPGWVKDVGAFSVLFNARAETVLEKPAFKTAMRHRRCIIPASAFYEWARAGRGRKIPHAMRRRDGAPLAFAGLWDYWADADGNELESAAIITVPASEGIAAIHHRMPAIVEPDQFEAWLDCVDVSAKKAVQLLKSAPDDVLEAFPVSDRVNSASVDDANLLVPVVVEEEQVPEPDPKPAQQQFDLF